MRDIKECIQSVMDFDFVNATETEIEAILPTFGMNDEYLEEIPDEFRGYSGWGIKFWQYPNQLTKLLCYLKDKNIKSYLEIGVRYGGTFILINELLRRYNPEIESHCVDIIPPSDILHTYQHEFVKKRFFYHETNSQSPFFFKILCGEEYVKPTKKIDLVFIDGCHSYTCVKQDYFTALMLGAKYLIFHDIVNQNTEGNRIVWSEIKSHHRKTYEFIDQYENMEGKFLGIGVVEITSEDNIFPLFETHYQ